MAEILVRLDGRPMDVLLSGVQSDGIPVLFVKLAKGQPERRKSVEYWRAYYQVNRERILAQRRARGEERS